MVWTRRKHGNKGRFRGNKAVEGLNESNNSNGEVASGTDKQQQEVVVNKGNEVAELTPTSLSSSTNVEGGGVNSTSNSSADEAKKNSKGKAAAVTKSSSSSRGSDGKISKASLSKIKGTTAKKASTTTSSTKNLKNKQQQQQPEKVTTKTTTSVRSGARAGTRSNAVQTGTELFTGIHDMVRLPIYKKQNSIQSLPPTTNQSVGSKNEKRKLRHMAVGEETVSVTKFGETVVKVKLLTGTLYIYKGDNNGLAKRRAEFVRSK